MGGIATFLVFLKYRVKNLMGCCTSEFDNHQSSSSNNVFFERVMDGDLAALLLSDN